MGLVSTERGVRHRRPAGTGASHPGIPSPSSPSSDHPATVWTRGRGPNDTSQTLISQSIKHGALLYSEHGEYGELLCGEHGEYGVLLQGVAKRLVNFESLELTYF